jgi:hypothetical protein
MNWRSNRGAGLVLAMIAVFLMTALSASLAMLTNTELRISASHAEGMELRYAAEAGLETIVREMSTASDWNPALVGVQRSAFSDGSPGGSRTLVDGSSISLDDLTAQVSGDNPTFRLFGYGPVQRLQPDVDVGIDGYLAVWIGGDLEANPAVLVLRAMALGRAGLRRMLEARLFRTEDGAVRVTGWHELR